MAPTISVIMAAYNSAVFIEEAVASVQAQTVTDWELIAVDDVSTDGSFEILQRLAEQDPRIKVRRMPQNSGAGAVRDAAIEQAGGAYIAVFDADDVCEPDRFEKQLAFMQARPQVIACGTQTVRIDTNGKQVGKKTFPTEHDELYRMMYNAIPIQLPTLMVNTVLLPAEFDWFEGLRYSEDTLLFFKLAHYGKIANLPEPLVQYRYYPQSTFCRNIKTFFLETWRIRGIARRRYGYKPTLRARLSNGLQFVVVSCVPAALLPGLYELVRRAMLLIGGQDDK